MTRAIIDTAIIDTDNASVDTRFGLDPHRLHFYNSCHGCAPRASANKKGVAQ